jgi:ribosomal protein S18 acetylase RimI-like enzyme
MDPDQIRLRPANPEDVSFLLELRRQTMHPHWLRAGLTLSPEEDMRRVMVRFDSAQIILVDSKPAGLLKVLREGTTWEVKQIQIAPRFQGQGLGTQLLESIVVEARQAGASLNLKVVNTNPARRLYERIGFTVFTQNAHRIEMRLET